MNDERRNPIDSGSRSTLALDVIDLVGTIATTVFAQSLSNFTCKLWMMRGGTLLIMGHGVKGQGQLCHSVYKTLWAGYRLQFLLNHFQSSHVSCGWLEEEPYWFWFTGSKVKVNFPPCEGMPCFALSSLDNFRDHIALRLYVCHTFAIPMHVIGSV